MLSSKRVFFAGFFLGALLTRALEDSNLLVNSVLALAVGALALFFYNLIRRIRATSRR